MLEDRLVAYCERLNPRFVVLTDYPSFHMHFAERLKALGFPVIQFVAPQLWAWKENRVKRLKRVTDMVLGIMPFEREFFLDRGVNFRYVGTPQVDRAHSLPQDSDHFLWQPNDKVIGLFPGSRRGELRRILPRMLAVAQLIRKGSPELKIAISIAPSIAPSWLALAPEFGDFFRGHDLSVLDHPDGEYEISEGIGLIRGRSLRLMQRVDAALVTSGTATLECALTGTPMAVAYVAHPFTYALAKRLVKLPHISLVNLVAGEKLVAEYVQEFSDQSLATELTNLVLGDERGVMMEQLRALLQKLQGQPGLNGATEIIGYLKQHGI